MCSSALHKALGVRYSGGKGAEARGVSYCSAYFKGAAAEIVAFLAGGGLKHGNVRAHGVIAAVLLVLGGVHAGVVRHHDDKGLRARRYRRR